MNGTAIDTEKTTERTPPKRKPAKRRQAAKAFSLPPLPSLLTRPLGLEGWTALEPVLLAALASEEPLLLIGPHGSAKSFLLERLAQVLGLEYRFYNASLINYDDLVGIPIPSEDRKSLHYISTPSAVWDAEVVFIDEINRTRPELQNKLFPIIHERRVQGIRLEKLRYRWSAMNPPPAADGADDEIDTYLGAEPLDPALADRFSLIIEVPGWTDLTEEEKRRVFRDQFGGEHPFAVTPRELTAAARRLLESLQQNPPRSLEDYLLHLLAELESHKIRLSTRRATMLHRNILAVHAARVALYSQAHPDLPGGLADWNTSALLALQCSLPQTAQGRKPDLALLLAAHRQAWAVSQLDDENPWRVLLGIKDPLQRCVAAVRMGPHQIDNGDLSSLITEALGAQPAKGLRAAAALALYAAVHRRRNLRATTYELLAAELRPILQPASHEHNPDPCPRDIYRKVIALCKELRRESEGPQVVQNRYAANLLQGILPDGYREISPAKLLQHFLELWKQLQDPETTAVETIPRGQQ